MLERFKRQTPTLLGTLLREPRRLVKSALASFGSHPARGPDYRELEALRARTRSPAPTVLSATDDGGPYDRQLTDDEIRERRHREYVGGMWDEIGRLQLEFLEARGLRPGHRLLDVGCGALRGGIHFIRYLDRGHYYGVDANHSLIRAARFELDLAGLGGRSPVLVVDGEFRFDLLGAAFPFAIAQSLFTHLPLNRIERCIANVARVLEPGGRLFATYFPSPECHALQDLEHPGGIVTHSDRDPFHYHFSAFEFLARALPLEIRNVGAWGHPRSQHMLEFIRR